MAYEQKNNSGTLFKNDKRDKDTQPNMKGKALIGGQWYWMSAWTNTPRAGGDKFQSVTFEEMTPEQVQQYGGGGNGQQRQQSNSLPARGVNRPNTPPGRAEQRARQPEAPFGNEQEFQDADIPF